MRRRILVIALPCLLICAGMDRASGWSGSVPEPTFQIDCRATIDSWVMSGYVKRGQCTCPSPSSSPVCSNDSAGSTGGRSASHYSAPAKKRNYNAELNAYVTGMVVEQLINMVFAPPPNTADMEKARAQAEWEQQQRLLQAQKERAQTASRLRSDWDQRDRESSDALSDFFSMPGGGRPGNDADVVALDENALGGTVRLLGSGAPDAPLPNMAMPTVQISTSPLQNEILQQGPEQARAVVWEILKGAALKAIPERWEHVKLAVEHVGKVNDFTGELLDAMEPQGLVAAAVSERPEASLRLLDSLDSVSRKAPTVEMSDELELGYKFLNGKEVTDDDLQTLASEKTKGYFIDQVSDWLVSGGMD